MPVPTPANPRNGVLLLGGYGIRVHVERGHLCVEDGVGARRRRARFPRPTRDLRRVVVLGHSGTVSFDAMRWLHDVGAGFVQIDHDGRVIAAAGPVGLRDARLRRAQAQAVENGRGLSIAKELARAKLAGQAALLNRLPGGAGAKDTIRHASERIDSAKTVEQLRGLEAEAALAYWKAWAPVEVRFARREADRVPTHWKTFGQRASLLTGSPRKAVNPANALLNYLYAVAESETKLAALAVGCDPGLGIMHADQQMRDSLACDLMEPVRPVVDAWVLDLLEARTFRRQNFFETRQGVCRIMPPLTKGLAETAPQWAAAVAPFAERLVRQLLGGSKRGRAKRHVPTPLTQANRSTGRDGIRVAARKPKKVRTAKLAHACVVCGAEIRGRGREFCVSCRPVQNREALSAAHEALLASRRAGHEPMRRSDVKRRIGRGNAQARALNEAWEQSHPGKA